MIFSIVVHAYNVENYLQRCIDSILHQTFEDYEIIIVDDGATDNTGKVADEIAAKYSDKIRVIHQRNKGLGGARNTGLENAFGEFVLFIDSDDYINPNLLEIAYKYLKSQQLDILVYQIKAVTEEMKCENEADCIDGYRIVNTKEYLLTCGPSACNKVYKRSIFIEGGIRYPEKLVYEDIATTPMTVLLAKKIGVIDIALYYYVARTGSITARPQKERIFEIHYGFDRVMKFFEEKHLIEEYMQELEFLAVVHAFYHTNIRVILSGGNRVSFLLSEKYMQDLFPNYKNNKYLLDEELLEKNAVDRKILNQFIEKRYATAKLSYTVVNRVKRIFNKIFSV